MPFPMTEIDGIPISRLMIGTNTFHGFSHFSKARDEWLKEHFTAERIYEVVRFCAEQGLNASVGGHRPDYMEILRQVETDTGVKIHYIATPHGEDLDDLKRNIDAVAESGATFCWPHQTWTDSHLLVSEDRIVDGEAVCEHVRACGMVPGWSTHRPETVVVSDRAGYDIGGYIQIFNPIGFLCQVETDWERRIIRNAKKPVVSIKPLGAGRVLPPTGLGFVYNNIKPVDTVAIGMLSVQEAEEDIRIARQCLQALASPSPEVELQFTRSKTALV